ncbi:MAG: hypothetical protein KUG77_26020 [Nannocystaceae bacterium]|nr:hypothetical protein [Nannocystaceae bacterium]
MAFSRLASPFLGLAALACGGCLEYLEPGELGQFRYLGDYVAEEEFLFPRPVADRNGSIYALMGSPDLAQTEATVGYPAGGGWRGRCSVHQNVDRGLHGWLDTTVDRAWYWSGDAIAEVNGRTSDCRQILKRDPNSQSQLAFKAVIPKVKWTPSRRTIVGLVQAPSDPVPFQVVIDLDIRRYSRFEEFVPRNADNVVSLGVGGDDATDAGFMVLRYEIGGSETEDPDVRVEARFLDANAEVTDIVAIDGLDAFEEDAMTGYMQIGTAGWAAGVLSDGSVLLFDRTSAQHITDTGPLEPVGVHLWQGTAWVVGMANGRPSIAAVNGQGRLDSPVVWAASERLASSLRANVVIQDDRFTPIRTLTWANPEPAFGAFPLVVPNAPWAYAADTSLMMIAGPGYTSGGQSFVSLAAGPVGLSYP